MKIFISGGCKTGKSTLAQRLAKKLQKADRPMYYLATMRPRDGEDRERIRRHQEERKGLGFTTLEIKGSFLSAVRGCDRRAVFLLDSLTALLAELMFPDGAIFPEAYREAARDMEIFLKEVEDIVIVSDFIFSDAQIYGGLTEKYRRGLAFMDKRAAGLCDVVIETGAGIAAVHKGAGLIDWKDGYI